MIELSKGAHPASYPALAAFRPWGSSGSPPPHFFTAEASEARPRRDSNSQPLPSEGSALSI